MRTGSCAGCGHRKKLYGDRCVGCLSAGAHGDATPGRQPPPWTDVGGGRVNARPSDPMREAQEHEAFDRHLGSRPKLPCGCSVGTRCEGAHARRPARHAATRMATPRSGAASSGTTTSTAEHRSSSALIRAAIGLRCGFTGSGYGRSGPVLQHAWRCRNWGEEAHRRCA